MEASAQHPRYNDGGQGRRAAWAGVKECGLSLEAAGGYEIDSPQEPLEGTEPYQHLDFSSERMILDF